jgi:GNAT superfamily N-acetyltransferase
MNSCSTRQPSDRHLRDLHFRSIREDDWTRLQRFHRRLSGTTVALRFHGGKRELSTPLAHYFTQLDGHDRVGLVATTGTRGRIVGVARYERLTASSAEVAFVVEDAYQGHGVGRRLMQRLTIVALENGISEFVADVLTGNIQMMRLLQETGPTTVTREGGESVVRVALSRTTHTPSFQG